MRQVFESLGGAFSGFCCAGAPLLLSFLSGIGLGFLINDFVLFPAMFLFLGLMFFSMNRSRKCHESNKPIVFSVFSALLLFVGIFFNKIIWIGAVGLFYSSLWDYYLIKKSKRCG